MGTNEKSRSELTEEKSLWDIYLSARRIKSSKFNTLSTALVFLLLVVSSWLTSQPIDQTVELIRKSAETGLSIGLSTLGLLLAGFTVFATISQPSLSIKMSEVARQDSGLSYLKHNYFIFLRVFIYYLIFSLICLFIMMFGHEEGLISLLLSLSPYESEMKFTIVKICYVILFTTYYFIIIQLKSFVFNIYHAVMTALRWKAEGHDY